MKIHTPLCPECGQPAIGTCDMVPGIALFDLDPDTGEADYTGETDMDWNNQETRTDGEGRSRVCCINGHEWYTRIGGGLGGRRGGDAPA